MMHAASMYSIQSATDIVQSETNCDLAPTLPTMQLPVCMVEVERATEVWSTNFLAISTHPNICHRQTCSLQPQPTLI